MGWIFNSAREFREAGIQALGNNDHRKRTSSDFTFRHGKQGASFQIGFAAVELAFLKVILLTGPKINRRKVFQQKLKAALKT